MAEQRSVYHAGGGDGMYMGAYLSCMFVLQAIGAKYIATLLVGNLMLICIPILAYILLRRGYKASGYTWTYSGIWLHGILMFLGGSLIMGLVMYLYMRFIQPDFVFQQVSGLISLCRSLNDPQYTKIADVYQSMIDKHLIPSPISLAFSMIWLVSFLGAMLSMVLACILKLLKKR